MQPQRLRLLIMSHEKAWPLTENMNQRKWCQTPSPWRTCRNAKNFTIFEEEPLCFNMRLNYKISTRGILIFYPFACCLASLLPYSSSTLLMGAGAVYFIKILHQHFDDNDLWKKWFNFSCNNSSRAGTWNLQQDCHKEAYMIPSCIYSRFYVYSRVYVDLFGS